MPIILVIIIHKRVNKEIKNMDAWTSKLALNLDKKWYENADTIAVGNEIRNNHQNSVILNESWILDPKIARIPNAQIIAFHLNTERAITREYLLIVFQCMEVGIVSHIWYNQGFEHYLCTAISTLPSHISTSFSHISRGEHLRPW